MRLKLAGFILLMISSAAAAEQSVRVETVDASSFEGQLLAISDSTVQIRTADGDKNIPCGEIVEMTISVAKNLTAINVQSLFVTDADRLSVPNISLAGEKVMFKNQLLGDAELPLTAAREIYVPGGGMTVGDLIAAVEKIPAPQDVGDVMYVEKKGGSIVALQGIVKGMDDEKVAFSWRDKDRSVSRKLVRAIRFAAVKSSDGKPAGVVISPDGSEVAFNSISFDGSKFEVGTKNFGLKTFEPASVAAIRFCSDCAVDLAAFTPAKVIERGFFGKDDHTFSYRVNRSVSGGELKLDGREYGAGLGLHSYSELTWKLDGKYSRFVAMLGIDDAVKSIGNVTVTFLADGKAVGEPVEISGKDKPQVVRLDIKGAAELTIRVDFGRDNTSAGDHLDIVSARLIR